MNKRQIGAAVPIAALRTRNGMGVGEFSDLIDFAVLCRKMRIGLIQILPVNDTGYESSPYASLTAFALHPLYLRIEELDEYSAADEAVIKQIKKARSKFGKNERFSHYQVLKEKLGILRLIYEANKENIVKSAGSGSLSTWIKKNLWVKEYAVYRRLKEANQEKSWQEWEAYSKVSADDIEGLWKDKNLREEHIFWVWLQQALDVQFSKAASKVEEIGIILKGDLPILMNEDSCDVWAHPELFNLELSAGAPPDFYSDDGQNWGFPIYNWEAHEKDEYSWWKNRLAVAEKYYKAYRIDHVLGFFRIWASSRKDNTASLGRFVSYVQITTGELKKIGFDKDKIRNVSQPLIPTKEIKDALKNSKGKLTDEEFAQETEKVFKKALTRIGDEEMWLFKKTIGGEKDITALELLPAVRDYLLAKWRDRAFLEYAKGKFSPAWLLKKSKAYGSLTKDEKKAVEDLIKIHEKKSDRIWMLQGKKLLSVLAGASSMLPCAEDLGAVPECVPKVLAKLKILRLCVTRMFCKADKNGEQFIPFEEYPQLSVCTPSVHDTSTVREWWEKETDKEKFSAFLGTALPKTYTPKTAKIILSKTASARSRFRIFQIQDLLHLSKNWYSANPSDERINVPGTVNDFNWTYRLPAPINQIAKDKELVGAVKELSRVKMAKKL